MLSRNVFARLYTKSFSVHTMPFYMPAPFSFHCTNLELTYSTLSHPAVAPFHISRTVNSVFCTQDSSTVTHPLHSVLLKQSLFPS